MDDDISMLPVVITAVIMSTFISLFFGRNFIRIAINSITKTKIGSLKLGVHTRDCICLRPDWTVASQSGRDSSASIAPTKPRTLSRPDPDLATLSRQLMCMHHGAIWCLDTHQ